MKNLLLLTALLICGIAMAKAQGAKNNTPAPAVPLINQNTSLIMRIDYALINGEDFTSTYKDWKQKFYMYNHNGKEMLASKGNESQSYGYLHNYSFEKTGSLGTIKGTWEFHNSYDDITGMMFITIIINYETNSFELEMRSKNSSAKALYKGHIEKILFPANR